MNDFFSKNWVRHCIRFLYALSWTVLLVLSLYYTDIIKSDSVRNIWCIITSDDVLDLESKSNKIFLPILVAMFLFWEDAAYIRMIEANEDTKKWKHHFSSILVGLFILIAIVTMMVKTYLWTTVVVTMFFTICCCYKLSITPLPPEVKSSNDSKWEVSKPSENPLDNK